MASTNKPVPEKLLRDFEFCDENTLEDIFLCMAKNVEDALLSGGAVPGKDYLIRDLFNWASPFALSAYNKNKNSSFAVGWPCPKVDE